MRFTEKQAGKNKRDNLNARGVVVGVFGFLALVGAAGLALIAAGSLGGCGAAAPAGVEQLS